MEALLGHTVAQSPHPWHMAGLTSTRSPVSSKKSGAVGAGIDAAQAQGAEAVAHDRRGHGRTGSRSAVKMAMARPAAASAVATASGIDRGDRAMPQANTPAFIASTGRHLESASWKNRRGPARHRRPGPGNRADGARIPVASTSRSAAISTGASRMGSCKPNATPVPLCPRRSMLTAGLRSGRYWKKRTPCRRASGIPGFVQAAGHHIPVEDVHLQVGFLFFQPQGLFQGGGAADAAAVVSRFFAGSHALDHRHGGQPLRCPA
jgi:hypothetical protein